MDGVEHNYGVLTFSIPLGSIRESCQIEFQSFTQSNFFSDNIVYMVLSIK